MLLILPGINDQSSPSSSSVSRQQRPRPARAQRRFAEMRSQGREVTLEAITADIAQRDARDMNRTDAPLKPAADALIFDTTNFGKDEAIEAAIEAVTSATER